MSKKNIAWSLPIVCIVVFRGKRRLAREIFVRTRVLGRWIVGNFLKNRNPFPK